MQVNLTGINTEITPPLRDYVERRCDKLERFDDRISKLQFTIKVEGLRHIAEILVSASAGAKIMAKEINEDMYAAVDLVIDKMEVQLKKHKEKLREHRSAEKLHYPGAVEADSGEPDEESYEEIVDQTDFDRE